MKSPIVYLIMMSKLVFMRVLKVWALFFLGRKDRKVWAFLNALHRIFGLDLIIAKKFLVTQISLI